jgi:hypothetical protein
MRGRYGWLILLSFVVVWDVVAAMTNGESLTYTFRRAVTDSVWRWPVLVVVVLLSVHLFLPVRLRQHDPLDRLYERISATTRNHDAPAPAPTPTPPRSPDSLVRPGR